jgi:hypothetical protein
VWAKNRLSRCRSPQVLDDLIAQRQVNHSIVAIQELDLQAVRGEWTDGAFPVAAGWASGP